MGDKSQFGASQQHPSAPQNPSISSGFVPVQPPPTYEESQQQLQNATAAPPAYPYPMHPANAQQFGYPNPYHMHLQQQQTFLQQHQPSPSPYMVYMPPGRTVEFDSHAVVTRTADGRVIVPPPPPGCAPTPGQLAAMQGQPVVVKQKKRSFL